MTGDEQQSAAAMADGRMMMTYRVTAIRNSREWYSWHATRKEAGTAAKNQRSRGIFQRVTVDQEHHGSGRVAESQAPSIRDGDAGLTPGRAPAVPERVPV